MSPDLRRRDIFLAAGAIAALLIILVLALHEYESDSLLRLSKTLPTIDQIEQDFSVWALDPKDQVLRGRPLTRHLFTKDASDLHSLLYALYTDREGCAVALTMSVLDWPSAQDPGIPESVSALGALIESDLKAERARLSESQKQNMDSRNKLTDLMLFINRYLGLIYLLPSDIDVLVASNKIVLAVNDLTDSHRNPGMSKLQMLWTQSGYTIELVVDPWLDQTKGHEASTPRIWTWIIRSADW